MQATCKEMKADMTKASSMFGYEIKKKHMTTMNNFFASKNFELIANLNASKILDKGGRNATTAKRGPSATTEKQPPNSV